MSFESNDHECQGIHLTSTPQLATASMGILSSRVAARPRLRTSEPDMKWRGPRCFPLTVRRNFCSPNAIFIRAANKQKPFVPSTSRKLYSTVTKDPQASDGRAKPYSANYESLQQSAKSLKVRCVELLSSQPTQGKDGELGTSFKDHLVTVTGRIRTIRKQKKIAFAALSDGSCAENVQVVFEDPAQTRGSGHKPNT